MRLKEIKTIKGKIILKTGLHIGSGNMEMQIGGTDNPVIKHPYTNEPYIPGSSLKGKIRSLLELYYGVVALAAKDTSLRNTGGLATLRMLNSKEADEEVKNHVKNILKVFGSGAGDVVSDELLAELGPTRVSFSDCFLTEEFKEEAKQNNWSYTEVKAENRINRIEGTAKDPRHTERVPSGAKFDFEVYFKVLEDTDEELFIDYLLKGLKLLEYDSLGGCGSRGYGKIKFEFDDEQIKSKFNELELWRKS